MKLPVLVVLSLLMVSACRTNESPEAQVNDMEIGAQVKAKLAKEVGMSTVTNVSVNSTNGIVTLSGQVDSPDAKARIEDAVKTVPKVSRVVDNLQIAPKQ